MTIKKKRDQNLAFLTFLIIQLFCQSKRNKMPIIIPYTQTIKYKQVGLKFNLQANLISTCD
ncbi:hypothetical protein Flavo103_36110 [Flavobacterium collinsii]|nr:hypothetical protein Flavo103_36110 [Flavobacterium collinsii]